MHSEAFTIDVAELRREVGSVWNKVCKGLVDSIPRSEDLVFTDGSRILSGTEVICKLSLKSHVDGLMLDGTISTQWAGMCRRCNADVGGDLDVFVKEALVYTSSVESGHFGHSKPQDKLAKKPKEIGEFGKDHRVRGKTVTGITHTESITDSWKDYLKIDKDLDDAYLISGNTLDLGELIHDILVLELPLVPLCKIECRGLCPSCGVDWNYEECECVAPIDPRWDSLNVLKDNPSDSQEGNSGDKRDGQI